MPVSGDGWQGFDRLVRGDTLHRGPDRNARSYSIETSAP